MTLEKFKEVLIPIELVWYAYYDKDHNTTNVVVLTPSCTGMSREIEICGNCLKQFNKWYNKVKPVNAPLPYFQSDGSFNTLPVITTTDGTTWQSGTTICSSKGEI